MPRPRTRCSASSPSPHQHPGNQEFVEYLRNRGKFLDHEESRERDLILIDYNDPTRNVYEVTEEWAFHNGRYGTREDVVFLINGIPVLVIECKNAPKTGDSARRGSDPPLPPRDTRAVHFPATLHCHRRHRLFLRRELEHGAAKYFQLEGCRGGKLEAKVKSFVAIPQVLAFLKDYIIFAEKDEELNKYILPSTKPAR